MQDYFYRFRPANALLDRYHELANGEIYFAGLNELNDPLEGFKDVIWRGDRIVWENLFKHYLLCLIRTVSMLGFLGQEFTAEATVNLVYETDVDLPEAPIRSIYGRACDALFSHQTLDGLLDSLCQAGKSVRRDELTYYLRLVHFSTMINVATLLEEHGVKIMTTTKSMTELAAKSMAKAAEFLRLLGSIADDRLEALFLIDNNISQQLSLIHELNSPIEPDRRSWLFIIRDFPSHYVTALERLLYPNWHTACFVTDPTSASMWGHYGDGHQGMCLKFRARPNKSGVPCLDLYKATSWGSDGKVGYSYASHPFEAIEYTATFPEVDFFQSLGQLPIHKLSQFCYAGRNGKRSEIAARVLNGDAQWREEYWRKFAVSHRTKLPEWSHENEHRIILPSSLDSLDGKDARKLKYRFEDLTGLIFGTRTSTENKIAAMRIIERKCIELRRTNFEFWQAYYSPGARRIELAQLGLIKIVPGDRDAYTVSPPGP